jgi:hypothetical protein
MAIFEGRGGGGTNTSEIRQWSSIVDVERKLCNYIRGELYLSEGRELLSIPITLRVNSAE